MYYIGQKIKNDGNYHKASIWCNKNNAHIEHRDGQYIIVENEKIEPIEVAPSLTIEELNEVLLAVIDRLDGGES